MITLRELDATTSLAQQLDATTGPVTVVASYLVPEQALTAFLALWQADAAVLTAAPGFRRTSLHRATAGGQLLWSVAEWESTQALAAAVAAGAADETVRRCQAAITADIDGYLTVFHSAALAEVTAQPHRRD